MRIDLLTSNDTQVHSPPTPLSMWRVGAILDAVAVRDATSGQLWLELENRRLPVRVASGNSEGPTNGEQLKLRVLRDSPVLALETLESQPQADVTGDALRRHLPQQTVPTPLLANLAWLMRGDGGASLPKGIADMIKQLWQNLPTAASLSDPATLAEALEKSGIFLEAALARSAGAAPADVLAHDFKAQLIALKQALTAEGVQTSPLNGNAAGPLPALGGALTPLNASPASFAVMENPQAQLQELAQQTHGSLARINSTQLINAEAAQTGIAACLIEIPYRQEDRTDLLRFRFEREKENSEKGDAGWTVEAALDLGVSGNLHARVTLQGKRLTVQLRSESPALVGMLDQHAPTLTAALKAEGFIIDRIACLHGAPVRDPGEQVLRLLDVHA